MKYRKLWGKPRFSAQTALADGGALLRPSRAGARSSTAASRRREQHDTPRQHAVPKCLFPYTFVVVFRLCELASAVRRQFRSQAGATNKLVAYPQLQAGAIAWFNCDRFIE